MLDEGIVLLGSTFCQWLEPVGVVGYAILVSPCLLYTSTTWCGPCKMMAPVVESLAGKYAGKIDFYKVDIDQESELASVFGLSLIHISRAP